MTKAKTKNSNLSEPRIVDRSKEIALFENHLFQLQSGHESAKAIIDFWGIPGIGKSTLLYKILRNSLSYKNKTIFIDFQEIFSNRKRLTNLESYELISAKLYNEMFKVSPARSDKKNSFNDITSELISEITNYLSLDKKLLVIILFDSVEYCRPEILQWLEKTIISPLISTKQALIVLAGQSRSNWSMFDVRQSAIDHKIQPFDLDLVWQQIGYDDHITKQLAKKIFEISFGVPACNRLVYNLLKRSYKSGNISVELSDFQKAKFVRSEVDFFLGKTVKKLSSELSLVLKLISQLRWFDYALLRKLLVSINSDRYEKVKASKFRDITRQLEETNYIRWNIQNRGFSMDFTLRKIMSLDLKMNDRALFLKIQQTVISWFKRLVKEYDSSYLFFLDLVYYRTLFGDLKPISVEIDDAIRNIQYSKRNHLDKIMTIEQVLRAINETEYKEMVAAEHIEQIRIKSEEALEKLLVIDNM